MATQQIDSTIPIGPKLLELATSFPAATAFSTSFGLEDQVISHVILTEKIPIRIFTLDTGRLPEETYALHQLMIRRYGARIETWFPDPIAVEKFVRENGPNAFFESVENRIECCRIRKVEPLRRALKGVQCWITGIRRAQSPERAALPQLERDESRGLFKFHPLLDWTIEEVRAFIRNNEVPYNPLHDRGYPSIGCAPCTRAILDGEDERAGRWWWESKSTRECGLHMKKGQSKRGEKESL